MKRKDCILSCLITMGLTSAAFSQTAMTQLFKVDDGGSLSWLNAGDGTRGMAYNPATGHLIVPDRGATSGDGVHILDSSTGAEVGTLNTTLMSGGNFLVSEAAVASDGTIYVANLVTAAGGNFKIYKYTNESDAGSVAVAATSTARRGDALAVTGTGTGTKLLVGGLNATTLDIYTTVDGVNFTATAVTPSGPGLSGMPNVAWDTADNSKFWWRRSVSAAETTSTLYTVTGTAAVGGVQIGASEFSGPIHVINDGSRNLMAVGSILQTAGTTGVKSAVYDTSGSATTPPVYVTGNTERTAGAVTNGNGVGEVALAVVGGKVRLYVLNSNNSISGWEAPDPQAAVEDWNLF